jgi:hypothetical protein
MKQLFGEKLELNIYTTDSEEAQKYNFKSSTNVLLDQELIPLDVSTDKSKMKDFISEKFAVNRPSVS